MQHTGLSTQPYHQTSLPLQCQLIEPLLQHSMLPCTQTISHLQLRLNGTRRGIECQETFYQLCCINCRELFQTTRVMGELSYSKMQVSQKNLRNNTIINLTSYMSYQLRRVAN